VLWLDGIFVSTHPDGIDMNELIARPFPGYALIDSGDGRKLEEILGLLVDRASPAPLWRTALSQAQWQRAIGRVERRADGGGNWLWSQRDPGELVLPYRLGTRELRLVLRFTNFGHVGIFPEQEPVWRLLHAAVTARGACKGLNLFGYTGAASLAMAAAGAEVFHVDSAKGVLTWGKSSADKSDLGSGSVRWIHEDCMAFLDHSRRKGFRYDVICADPPAWGHGKTKDQTWKIDEQLQQLAEGLAGVVSEGGVVVLCAHAPGVQHSTLANILQAAGLSVAWSGDLAQAHRGDQRLLPAGVCAISAPDAQSLMRHTS
jgi:23S rRNA (cytosine1962-C5)-methyltransferase